MCATTLTSGDNEGIPFAQLDDVNGDGLADVIVSYTSNHTDYLSQNKVWLNTGWGFSAASQSLPATLFSIDETGYPRSGGFLADVDGDGRSDIVSSIKNQDGSVNQKTWLNQSVGNTVVYQVSMAYKIPALLLDYSSNAEGESRGELVDINSDGLADVVISSKTSAGIHQGVYLNTGQGFKVDSGYQLPVVINDYIVNTKGVSMAQLTDINGDGLIDIWQAVRHANGNQSLNAWLNNGIGFISASNYTPPQASIGYRSDGTTDLYGSHMDLDADGRPEYVIYYRNSNNITYRTIWQHNGGGWMEQTANLANRLVPIPLYQHFTNQNSTPLYRAADLNRDLLPEVFTSFEGSAPITYSGPSVAQGERPGVLVETINGLKVVSRLKYGLSNDPHIYTPGSQDSVYPNIKMNSPRALVSRVYKMDGLRHPNSIFNNLEGEGWYKVDHQYQGFRTNITGRGGLGLEAKRVSDARTNTAIETTFHQDWPLVSLTKKSTSFYDGQKTSETENFYQVHNFNNNNTIYSSVSEVRTTHYDRGEVLTKINASEIDEFANTVFEESKTLSGGQEVSKVTRRRFENDTSRWVLGKQLEVTVTNSATGLTPVMRMSTAEYLANGYVKSESINPDHELALSKIYEYDGFGNVIKTTTKAGDKVVTTTSTYTEDGRFPASTTNPLGFISTVAFSPLTGKVLRATDPNGLTKETVYNKFGMVIKDEIKREEARGKRKIALPYWCEAATTPTCPTHAMYFVAALDDQGEAPQTVYFDAYSREILKKSVGYGEKQVLLETQYDSQGRKVAVSQPRFEDEEAKFTRSVYDAQGRVVKQISVDGAEVSINKTLLFSSVTNALNQTRTVENNLKGKPIRSTDFDGNSMTYRYDVEGRLLTTNDPNGNVVENRYDLLGRKVYMSDPDMGIWNYTYDAFGNMLSQTDAKGQVVTMEYDVLNRLVKRTEPEGVTRWTFDTAALGNTGMNAKGALHQVTSPGGYVRTHDYDQFGRAIKEETTIKGNNYATERGYHRASNKVAWTKYPSGLTTRLEQDSYGFPKRLSSMDVGSYGAYRSIYDQYQDAHYAATGAYDEVKDQLKYHQEEFEKYQTVIKPVQEEIEGIYEQAKTAQEQADEWGAKVSTQSNLAQTYYNQYLAIHKNYVQWTNVGNAKSGEAQNYARKGQDAASNANYWARSARAQQNNLAKILGGICHNNYDVALKGAECQEKEASEETAKTAEKWAKHWGPRIEGDFKRAQQRGKDAERYYRTADSRARESQDAYRKTQSYYNSARTKENLMRTHNDRAQSYLTTQKTHLTTYENLAGKWDKRSKVGSQCIEREGVEETSEYCLVTKGQAQVKEDALKATNDYEQLVYHRAQYDEIVAPVTALNEQVKVLEEQVTSATDSLETTTKVYWEALAFNARGQAEKVKYGNGVESEWAYDSAGRMLQVAASKENDSLQSMFFQYNAIGNLTERSDTVSDLYEQFTYDNMNRLTDADLSGQGATDYQVLGLTSQSFEYDALGNITYKSDVGHYQYGQGKQSDSAGVHALISTSGMINASFTYDANGNQTQGNGKVFTFASFNKPTQVTSGQGENRFEYGPERQMVYQSESIGSQARETRYVGGIYEENRKGFEVESIHHLTVSGHPIAVIKTASDLSAVNDTHYLHQDHLDSIVMITDDIGEVVERRHYDAFGKLRTMVVDQGQQVALAGILPLNFTDRSFTGHKYLKAHDLVHMKGRVYDATFGRFVSADPHIEAPLNTQSFNRYSYVWNNPLSVNDPSGYFLGGLIKSFKKFVKNTLKIIKQVVKAIVKVIEVSIKVYSGYYAYKATHNYLKKQSSFYRKYNKVIAATVAAIAITYFTAGAAAGWAASLLSTATTTVASTSLAAVTIGGAISGALAGAASGLILTGSLKGALTGALTGAIAVGVGGYFSGLGAGSNLTRTINSVKHTAQGVVRTTKVVLSGLGHTAKAVSLGVAGGLSSKLSGGSFSKGFNLAFAIAGLGEASQYMRNSMIDQSTIDIRNATGESAGFKGDDFKLGGGRHDPNVSNQAPSELGGIQGRGGEIFGRKYAPGSLQDLVVEAFAGPHDFLNNRIWYNQLTGNIRPGTLSGSLGQAVNLSYA